VAPFDVANGYPLLQDEVRYRPFPDSPPLHFTPKLREFLEAIFASYLQAPAEAGPERLLDLLVAKHRREVRLGWETSESGNRLWIPPSSSTYKPTDPMALHPTAFHACEPDENKGKGDQEV
jgi:hypothetical protein